jgi:DNA primase
MGGLIPNDFIDAVLERSDIVELIGARVPLRKAGQNFTACCPFHSEKTPSFTVSPSKQFYHCFGCGAHGTALGFLMEHDKLSFPEAVEELAGAVGLEVPKEARAERSRDTGVYDLVQQADQYFQEALRSSEGQQRAVEYLKQRGLTGEIAAVFGIGYAPNSWDGLLRHLTSRGADTEALVQCGLVVRNDKGRTYDRFRDRVMFPIRDRRGRTIAFGGRVLGDDTPKYLNSPESSIFHKGRTLYGLQEALGSDAKPARLVVVEGYMDVVALAQFGIHYAVAALGTSATREHLQAAFRAAPTLVFCFDGDRAGRMAAKRAMENALPLIEGGREARFLFLPEGEDPDSLVRQEGSEAFARRLDAATPLSEFLMEQLSQEADLNSREGRARVLERAKPFLAEVPAGAFRELLHESLGDISHQPVEMVRRIVTGTGAPRRVAQAPVDTHRTVVRHAIALLLHRPGLAAEIEIPSELASVPERGAGLLANLLEIARDNPHLNGAAMIERYRNSEHWEALSRLCQWQPEIPEERLRDELADTLRRLRERHTPHRAILEKLAHGETLNELEREILRRGTTRTKGI